MGSLSGDLKHGVLEAAMSDAMWYRVSAGTGQANVGILWPDDTARWICSLYSSVATREIVEVDVSMRFTLRVAGNVNNQGNKEMIRWCVVRVNEWTAFGVGCFVLWQRGDWS